MIGSLIRTRRHGASRRYRRGHIVVLTAVILVVLLIMVAFAIDGGVVALVRTELQRASDSAALAGATKIGYDRSEVIAEADRFAAQNKKVGGDRAELRSHEVQVGIWDRDTRKFTPGERGNAVKVTTRSTGQGTFFARVMGANSFDGQATAIAMAIPRDIVFVVDQSGSMNDDSEPAWAPQAIGSAGNSIASTLGSDLFGHGISPSDAVDLQAFVNAAGYATAGPEYAYAVLTMDEGPLSKLTDSSYRIVASDSESTRKAKAYRWLREQLLQSTFSGATPPYSMTDYWDAYLDYVIRPVKHSFPPPDPPPVRPKEPTPPTLDYSPCCTNCGGGGGGSSGGGGGGSSGGGGGGGGG
ncbi:MAG: hypothetical protein KDA59_07450, partial [Planctomycetales bacterium]|nr:hypothetical protein [Planctomycetales bacterium]